MFIFQFLKFYNFRPFLLYFTYELFQTFITLTKLMYLCLNKLTSKYLFLYTLYKAHRISESSFSHLFTVIFPFSFVTNATNFFNHSLNRFVLKKCCLRVAGFLQLSAVFVPCICKYTI